MIVMERDIYKMSIYSVLEIHVLHHDSYYAAYKHKLWDFSTVKLLQLKHVYRFFFYVEQLSQTL